MDAITLSVVVGEDRRIVIELPPDMPLGPAQIVVRSLDETHPIQTEREQVRAKLASILSTAHYAPPDAVPLSEEELERLGRLFAGSRPSEDLISEDRGAY